MQLHACNQGNVYINTYLVNTCGFNTHGHMLISTLVNISVFNSNGQNLGIP